MLQLDVAIDGSDEVDPDLNLVKGRGGALLREKVCRRPCLLPRSMPPLAVKGPPGDSWRAKCLAARMAAVRGRLLSPALHLQG